MISECKDSDEYSTNMAMYFYNCRVDAAGHLREKNPNLDVSDLEVAEASQDDGSKDPDVKSDQDPVSTNPPTNDPIVPSVKLSKDNRPQPSV